MRGEKFEALVRSGIDTILSEAEKLKRKTAG